MGIRGTRTSNQTANVLYFTVRKWCQYNNNKNNKSLPELCWQPLNEKRKKEKQKKEIWDFSDSNQGPIDLQSNALPAAPKSHYIIYFFN